MFYWNWILEFCHGLLLLTFGFDSFEIKFQLRIDIRGLSKYFRIEIKNCSNFVVIVGVHFKLKICLTEAEWFQNIRMDNNNKTNKKMTLITRNYYIQLQIVNCIWNNFYRIAMKMLYNSSSVTIEKVPVFNVTILKSLTQKIVISNLSFYALTQHLIEQDGFRSLGTCTIHPNVCTIPRKKNDTTLPTRGLYFPWYTVRPL